MKNLPLHDKVNMTLRRLEQYSTISPFCRLFYRAIYNWLDLDGLEAQKLNQAFQLFLRCECRRHQAIGRIVRRGRVNLDEVMKVGHDTQVTLARISRTVECLKLVNPREAMIRELILAECDYHLGRTDTVVSALKRAIHLGCDHPLTHFALGYNLYLSALEDYSRAGSREARVIVTEPVAFEKRCEEAIAAFQQGLGDSRFDAQISWWVGLVSEIIGEQAVARKAFSRAMQIDPENFGSMGHEKIEALDRAPASRSPSEWERLSHLGPITAEDIHAVRQQLAVVTRYSDIFPET